MEVNDILSKHGVSIDSLVEAAFALYVEDGKRKDQGALRSGFREMLEHQLRDPNVALLLEAASHLDDVVKAEAEGIFRSSKDPASLVADELIGMSIAEYISGKRGLFNYVRYDKAKPGILNGLPPFMDDAVGALVAATMTKLFEE
jgi:alpha-ribazole phosphatase CobZ